MSCSSGCNCNSNPCVCDASCDPANEPLSSALQNFITAFFGSLTKTCVNGDVQWLLPCSLETGVEGFPRISGEGLACYFSRIFALLAESVVLSPSAYVGANFTQPAQGGSVQITTIGANGQGNSSEYTVGDTIYIGDGTNGGYYTVTNIDDSSHITVTSVTNITNAGDTITTNNNIYISNSTTNPTNGLTAAQPLVASVSWSSPNLTYVATGLTFVNGICIGRFIPNNISPVTVLTAEAC